MSTEQATTPDPAPTDGLPPYSDDLVDKALSYVDQRGGSAARAEVILATEVRSLREVRTGRNALRAELARVRPVVDAARAWKVYRDEHPEALPYLHPAACVLYDAVAALERVYVAAAVAALDGTRLR